MKRIRRPAARRERSAEQQRQRQTPGRGRGDRCFIGTSPHVGPCASSGLPPIPRAGILHWLRFGRLLVHHTNHGWRESHRPHRLTMLPYDRPNESFSHPFFNSDWVGPGSTERRGLLVAPERARRTLGYGQGSLGVWPGAAGIGCSIHDTWGITVPTPELTICPSYSRIRVCGH
jgi:hypothetical protein